MLSISLLRHASKAAFFVILFSLSFNVIAEETQQLRRKRSKTMTKVKTKKKKSRQTRRKLAMETENPVVVESKDIKSPPQDHLFLPSFSLAHPFIDTHVDSFIGLGYIDIEVPVHEANYGLISLVPSLEYQQALSSFLAAELGIAGNVMSGTNAESALTLGAMVGFSVFSRLLIRVINTEKHTITFVPGVSLGRDYMLSPLAAITQSIEKGTVNSDSLLLKYRVWSFESNIRYSFAINRTFGILGGLGIDFRNSKVADASENTTAMNFGLGLNLDFEPRTTFPLGLTFSYKRSQPISGDPGATNYLEIGAFETSKKGDFSFGAVFSASFSEFDISDTKQDNYFILPCIRAYF